MTGAVDQWKDKQIISIQITEGRQKAIGLAKGQKPLSTATVLARRTGEFCRWAASAGAACTVSASICVPGRQSFVSCKKQKPKQPIDQISTHEASIPELADHGGHETLYLIEIRRILRNREPPSPPPPRRIEIK